MAISLRTRRAALKIVVERMAKNPAFAGIAKKPGWRRWTPRRPGTWASPWRPCARSIPRMLTPSTSLEHADLLPSPSLWIFGGDGWAYDIGYGGLDHILASRENFNVLVFDTEVYSNTGGQASKATPPARWRSSCRRGQAHRQKGSGPDRHDQRPRLRGPGGHRRQPRQTLKALREAEAYDGPSLIIAYSPCINHGLKAGMNRSMVEMKKAVRAGYWNLFAVRPRLAEAGKNPCRSTVPSPTRTTRPSCRERCAMPL